MTIIFIFATSSLCQYARFHKNISAIISQRKMTHGCKQRRHLRFGESYAMRTQPIWKGNKRIYLPTHLSHSNNNINQSRIFFFVDEQQQQRN